MDLKASFDPPENTLIERIMFYGDNYLIFLGINYIPGYTLQMLINNVFKNKNDFTDDFKKKCYELTSLVLNISD